MPRRNVKWQDGGDEQCCLCPDVHNRQTLATHVVIFNDMSAGEVCDECLVKHINTVPETMLETWRIYKRVK